jgi:tetratricopeptide (TPR) repeat protein
MTDTSEQTSNPTPNKTKLSFRRSLWMIDHVEETLHLVPDEAERYHSIALIKVMRGQFSEAIQYLNKTLALSPKHFQTLWLAGEIHFKLAHYEKAATLLEEVVRIEPDNLTAITWLALAYHCLKDQGKAINAQSILQEIAPDLMVSVNK